MADLKITHIWVAQFNNDEEQNEIFYESEEYGTEEGAISIFSRSQDEGLYDNDRFYISKNALM